MDTPTITISDSTAKLVTKLCHTDRKFRLACKQVILLNNQIRDLKQRYKRCGKNDKRSFCCSLRLRMATFEGVRNMIYEYATEKCEEIEKMQDELVSVLDIENQC